MDFLLRDPLVREVCEIKFAHILSLWDNLKIAAPPLPHLSQFCKKCANVPGNFAIYFCPIFSPKRRSTASASISHIPTSRRVRKSEHLPYISYQIHPTMAIPEIMNLRQCLKMLILFLIKINIFWDLSRLEKKYSFVGLGVHQGLNIGFWDFFQHSRGGTKY